MKRRTENFEFGKRKTDGGSDQSAIRSLRSSGCQCSTGRVGTRYADWNLQHGGSMEHTHEYDCIVCGAHFDSQDDLAKHDRESHAPREAIDVRAPAEPMGNERPRQKRDDDKRMS